MLIDQIFEFNRNLKAQNIKFRKIVLPIFDFICID